MANLNRVLLIGNLTRGPDIRYTPKGTAVAEIGIAINRVFTGEEGEKREEVIYIDVTLWSRRWPRAPALYRERRSCDRYTGYREDR
jgi:single-strand DNA-binding protein